uniref:Uncharacterized protein n=1 Tax=Oryza punctata TaxID=4537 RepID=A0A0E0KN26_ORYPU
MNFLEWEGMTRPHQDPKTMQRSRDYRVKNLIQEAANHTKTKEGVAREGKVIRSYTSGTWCLIIKLNTTEVRT